MKSFIPAALVALLLGPAAYGQNFQCFIGPAASPKQSSVNPKPIDVSFTDEEVKSDFSFKDLKNGRIKYSVVSNSSDGGKSVSFALYKSQLVGGGYYRTLLIVPFHGNAASFNDFQHNVSFFCFKK